MNRGEQRPILTVRVYEVTVCPRCGGEIFPGTEACPFCGRSASNKSAKSFCNNCAQSDANIAKLEAKNLLLQQGIERQRKALSELSKACRRVFGADFDLSVDYCRDDLVRVLAAVKRDPEARPVLRMRDEPPAEVISALQAHKGREWTTGDGWRHDRQWSSAHFFLGGASLCDRAKLQNLYEETPTNHACPMCERIYAHCERKARAEARPARRGGAA